MAPALSVRQLNALYNRSPNSFINQQVPLADPMQALHNTALKRPPVPPTPIAPPPPPPVLGIPALLALPAAVVLVLLTPKPTANEDAILKRLKKQELDKKIVLDPFESPVPEPPPFLGGQGKNVGYSVRTEFSNPIQWAGTHDLWGPILGSRVVLTPRNNGLTIGSGQILCHGAVTQAYSPEPIWFVGSGSPNWDTTREFYIASVTRLDGKPDTDGNLSTPAGTPKPNTLADPNRLKRERGDRPAPAASPKYFDPRPAAPGAGWGHAVPPDKRRQTTRSGTPTPTPTRAPSASPAPAPTKVYFPQAPLQISPQPAPQPTPQERPFPPQSVPAGISPQPAPQPLAPPSQKTDTAPFPVPTSRPAFSPPAPGRSPSTPRAPVPIPAPQPVIITGPASDPGKAGPITYSSPPQNFVPNPTTLAPTPIAPPQVKPPVEPAPQKTPLEDIREKLEKLIIPVGTLGVGITQLLKRTTPGELEPVVRNAVCQTTEPGGCTTGAINRGNQDLLNKLGVGAQGVDLTLLGVMNNKLGNQITGGLSGGLGRMSSFLGIDRALNLLAFLANLHNASMLSASLKVTLLETLSSIGNATGLLQTSEGENVELNKVFDQGIETFITKIIGVDAWASMKLEWRKYSSIYRAGSNVLSNVGNMFSSIGNGIEEIGERSGKIGNALMAAGAIRENAFPQMSESMTVHTNKFMSFQTKIGGATEFVEAINEVAESVIEGQESFTEATKAATEFKKQLAVAEKNPLAGSTAIQAEAEKVKANLIKDPTGEDEQGLLSFLTDL